MKLKWGKNEILRCLDNPDTREEDIQKYLTDKRRILLNVFGEPFFYDIIFPKFKFGNKYVSDFVIVTGQSNSYYIHLIELEPASKPIFTKEGKYSARLNGAIKQVEDWDIWIKDNLDFFKKELRESIKVKYPTFDETFNYTRRFIIYKHIVIGRRSSLSDDNKNHLSYANERGLDIVTYDRLIDMEKS